VKGRDVDALPIIISVFALAVSEYGILERKDVARRLERIRLSELLDTPIRGTAIAA
jgi:hypothetical protein